jgi:hypothetical protein
LANASANLFCFWSGSEEASSTNSRSPFGGRELVLDASSDPVQNQTKMSAALANGRLAVHGAPKGDAGM